MVHQLSSYDIYHLPGKVCLYIFISIFHHNHHSCRSAALVTQNLWNWIWRDVELFCDKINLIASMLQQIPSPRAQTYEADIWKYWGYSLW